MDGRGQKVQLPEIFIDPNKITGAALQAAMQAALRQFALDVNFSRSNEPGDLFPVRLALDGFAGVGNTNLSTEHPSGFKIDFPFKSIYVGSASDAEAVVHFMPGTSKGQSNIGLQQNVMPLSLKDSVHLDAAQAQGLIIWPSQPGKWVNLIFSVNSKIFTGSTVQLVSGGVTLTNGSEIFNDVFGPSGTSGSFPVTGTADVILAANSARKVARFRVSGGDIRIGDSPTTTTGMLLPDGSLYEHRNTGALMATLVAGAPVITGTEET